MRSITSILRSKFLYALVAISAPLIADAQQSTLTLNGVTCNSSGWSVNNTPTTTSITIPASCLPTVPPVCSTCIPITGSFITWTPANPVLNSVPTLAWNAGTNATSVTVDCDKNYFQGAGVAHAEALQGTGTPSPIQAAITCTMVARNTTGAPAITLTATATPQTPGSGLCTNPSSQDCTIEGDVVPTISREFGGRPSPFRQGKLNGDSYGDMNMYAMADTDTKCANSTPKITRLWQHNISFAGYITSGNDHPLLAPNQAMSWKFVAPAEGLTSSIRYSSGIVPDVPVFLSISTKPCDFDVTKASGPTRSTCFASSNTTASVNYVATAGNLTGTESSYACKLQPGATYYFNMRLQDAITAPTVDSCTAKGQYQCGGFVQFIPTTAR